MLRLALIGKNVSASLSPGIHDFILGRMGETCTFEKVSIPEEEFPSRAEELFTRYDGFNVTIPYKREIRPYLNELCEDAKTFHSVNTVVTKTRKGYNSDGFGFLLMLQTEGVELRDKKVLVLGTGGAGRSCIEELAKAGAQVYAYNRTADRLDRVYAAFHDFTPLYEVPLEQYDIIVNCTGIGMHDTVGRLPQLQGAETEQLLKMCETAVDLIYYPEKSEFLRVAEGYGKRIINGFGMLFYQAYMADCIFLNRQPSAREAEQFYRDYTEAKK